MTGPEKYLKVLVPVEIRCAWRTWAAVQWRLAQHYNRPDLYPPDQRFTVSPQAGMCPLHHEQWISWRQRWFKGQRWPGAFLNGGLRGGDGFQESGVTVAASWDRARAEWDEKTREQMRVVESICLSGRSVQCGERDEEVAA